MLKGNIPQGLMATMTLCLTVSARRLHGKFATTIVD